MLISLEKNNVSFVEEEEKEGLKEEKEETVKNETDSDDSDDDKPRFPDTHIKIQHFEGTK